MGKKFKMPKLEEFLEKKTTGGTKSDPIWVILEKEMRENTDKPYNEKVGNWLKYLEDLKYHFHCEAQRKENRLNEEVGPAWYIELSSAQREVLANLKTSIHADLLEDIPNRVRRSLSDLGITMKISKKILMKAMGDSVEDPGVFIWNLYSEIYKTSPSELQPKYDINAMILMSSLVFIDLDECVKKLNDLTHSPKPPPPPPKPKKPKPKPCKEPLGMYKQEQTVPFVSNHPSEQPKKKKPLPIGYKFRLRSESSYEKITKDQSFLEKRKDRNKKEKQVERECNYKFWEPPSTLRNTDPKMAAYVNKLKMFKKRAKPKHKAPFNNAQYLVGGVSFTGGTPSYIVQNVSLLPTGYIPINGGVIAFGKEFVTWIQGYWKYPKEVIEKCVSTCDCLTLWESKAMDYIHASKCKCGHLYDYQNEGKVKEKYFYPPNKHGSYWIDKAKIYQLNPTEDFIRDTFADALKSIETTPQPSTPTISASGLKEKELVAAFLADVADTPLVIPHLPQANLLNNLQEWARKRVKGDLTPKQGKKLLHKSQRRWLDLKGIDFVAKANMIPFTLKQLENMDWSHRALIQHLFQILMNDFVDRNRLKQVEQTRLWWATTQYDAYPSKAFLDIFYTYMPPRVKDTFLIDPYSHARTPKYGAKTCPLR